MLLFHPSAYRKKKDRSKKKRLNRKEKQREERAQRKEAGLAALGLLPVDAPSDIGIIRLPRRPELREEMKDKTWYYEDDIFKEFHKFGHRGTGMFVVLDKETDELVFAARTTETKDMNPEKREMFNRILITPSLCFNNPWISKSGQAYWTASLLWRIVDECPSISIGFWMALLTV
jgi:hypothetical protein